MTPQERETMLKGIADITDQIAHYFGSERHKYLLGLREGLNLCCHADPTQQLGNLREMVEFGQFVETQLDACYKDKHEDRS
jgi:hypothetical protein